MVILSRAIQNALRFVSIVQELARLAARKYARIIQKIGFQVEQAELQ